MKRKIARRAMLLALVGGSIAGLNGCQTIASAQGDTQPIAGRAVTVIYIGADDCPYCHTWEMYEERAFLASQARQAVTYRRLIFQGYNNITSDSVWPSDLKWVRERLGLRSGSPRFIVLRDREILASTRGGQGWKNVVLPLIAADAG